MDLGWNCVNEKIADYCSHQIHHHVDRQVRGKKTEKSGHYHEADVEPAEHRLTY